MSKLKSILSYFNTTSEKEQLITFKEKASKQDDIIKSFFKKNPDKEVIASEVWISSFNSSGTPLTSVRRSINTLFNRGIIERVLDESGNPLKIKCHLFGRKVFVYKLSK